MRKSIRFLTALFCAGFASGIAQAQQNQQVFSSARQAFDVFQNASDDTGREAAYNWLQQYAARCPTQEANDVFGALGKMARSLDRDAEFVAVCEQISTNAVPEVKNTIASQLADWHSAVNDFEGALSALAGRLEAWEGSAAQLSPIAQKAASILSLRLQRHADAGKVLTDAEARFTSEDDATAVASLLNAHSILMLSYFEDLDGAEKLAREALAFGDKCSWQVYSAAAYQLAAIEKARQNREGAVAACMLVLRHAANPPSGSARRVVDAGANAEEMETSIGLLRSRMASEAQLRSRMTSDTVLSEYQSKLERVQLEVVELLGALGRHEEAAKECRVFMLAANDRQYAQAVGLAARVLKSLDGNLGRANAFLDFQQQSGPAAGAEISGNVLMSFAPLDDAVRTDAMKALAEMPEPADWQAWLMRSMNLLWLDRPADAMEAAAAAFAACPISDAALQACATATARPLLIATRDTAAAQELVDYLLFGSLGRDGSEGTADDLADPFPEARRRLRTTAQAGK